jgi:hypothetical protein
MIPVTFCSSISCPDASIDSIKANSKLLVELDIFKCPGIVD